MSFLIFINKPLPKHATIACFSPSKSYCALISRRNSFFYKIHYRTCCSFLCFIVSSTTSNPAHFLTLFATLFLLFPFHVFPILSIAFSQYFSFNLIPIYSIPNRLVTVPVVPLPKNGSNTISHVLLPASIQGSMSFLEHIDICPFGKSSYSLPAWFFVICTMPIF